MNTDTLMGATGPWYTLWGFGFPRVGILTCGLAICIWGVGALVRRQMASFSSALPRDAIEGIPKGGAVIGRLERLLIFMFVVAGKPEGVGFLVAAKSVFRIGELTNREDKAHAEYIMIGTLRSFAYALLVAFLTVWVIGKLA